MLILKQPLMSTMDQIGRIMAVMEIMKINVKNKI